MKFPSRPGQTHSQVHSLRIGEMATATIHLKKTPGGLLAEKSGPKKCSKMAKECLFGGCFGSLAGGGGCQMLLFHFHCAEAAGTELEIGDKFFGGR